MREHYLQPGSYSLSWEQPGDFSLSQDFVVPADIVHRGGFEPRKPAFEASTDQAP